MRIWVQSDFSHLLLLCMNVSKKYSYYPTINFPTPWTLVKIAPHGTLFLPVRPSASCHELHQSLRTKKKKKLNAFSYCLLQYFKKILVYFLPCSILTFSMCRCNHVLDCKPLRAEILSPSREPGIMLGTTSETEPRYKGGWGDSHQNLWEAEVVSLGQIEYSSPHHIIQWPGAGGDNPEKELTSRSS